MDVEALNTKFISALDISKKIVADHNCLALLKLMALEENLIHMGVGLFTSNV
jgi:hypothetical protein